MKFEHAISWSLSCLLLCAELSESFVVTPHTRTTSHRKHGSLQMTPPDLGAIFHSLPSMEHTPWETYSNLLVEKPLKTKAITAAVLASAGDAVAQFRSFTAGECNHNSTIDVLKAFGGKIYDPKRGLAFLAFGAIYTGCFQHVWFSFLNSHVADWGETIGVWGHPAVTKIPVANFIKQEEWWTYFDVVKQIEGVVSKLQAPPSDAVLAAAKVAVNQFAVVPVVYMPLFFGVTGALGGLDLSKSVARARSLYVPLLQRNYLFWLPMQFIQFLVLPVEWQIPFLCVASFWWTVILSSIGGSTTPAASPSTILVYETTSSTTAIPSQQEGDLASLSAQQKEEVLDDVVTIMPVSAGAVNEIIDAVLFEDVTGALVPQTVLDAVGTVGEAVEDALAVGPSAVGASAGGLALGLLAASADEATIGAAVGSMLGEEAQFGVAVLTAVGAGVGYLVQAAAVADDDEVDEEFTKEELNGA